MTRSLPPLSRREREILEVLFEIGADASAEQIRERLADPPTYSAVRAMLAKLEAKGAIRHREEGPRYVYSPTMPRSRARRSALQRLVRVFFEGSPSGAAAGLLQVERWTDEQLAELESLIRRARENRS